MAFHSGLTVQSQLVNAFVVPDPSERWATVMPVAGRLTLGLSALIAGSSQVVIWPV